jgi:hypothetical protein
VADEPSDLDLDLEYVAPALAVAFSLAVRYVPAGDLPPLPADDPCPEM